MQERLLDLASAPHPLTSNPGTSLVSAFPANVHICHFYRSQRDLLELMVPYFLEGLAMGNFCLWGVAAPLTVQSATDALDEPLGGALPLFLSKGQIEIFDITQLYGDGTFDAMAVKDAFLQKVAQTREKGWAGFRCDGMASGVSPRNWRNYQTYELEVTRTLRSATTALCSYDTTKLSAEEIVDVVNTHQASILKRDGKWTAIGPLADAGRP
jgi:hypothetical protein